MSTYSTRMRELERSNEAAKPRPRPRDDFELEPPPVTITPDEVAAAKGKLREFARSARFGMSTGLEWARELRERELNHGGVLRSGQRMTQFQRDAWRSVLDRRRDVGPYPGEDLTPDEIADRKRLAEQRIHEYAAQRGIDLGGDR